MITLIHDKNVKIPRLVIFLSGFLTDLVHSTRNKLGDTLLFLDEIQSCHEALDALKYFSEDPEDWHVIVAGSYLGVTLSKGESFPVGKVDFLELMPMTFLEFLMALHEALLADWLMTLAHIEPMYDTVFDKRKALFRWCALPFG